MISFNLLQKKLRRFVFCQFLLHRRGSHAERQLRQQGFHRDGPDTLNALDQGQTAFSSGTHNIVLETIRQLLQCKVCRCDTYYEWTLGSRTLFSCWKCGHLHPVERRMPELGTYAYYIPGTQQRLRLYGKFPI